MTNSELLGQLEKKVLHFLCFFFFFDNLFLCMLDETITEEKGGEVGFKFIFPFLFIGSNI